MRMFLNRFWLPTLLLLPCAISLLVFFMFPTFNMFYSSLREINIFRGTSEFVGFRNYILLFDDIVFLRSLRNTIIYVVSVTLILVPLSFFVALLMDFCPKMGAFVRGILYFPSIVTMSVAALMWRFLLAYNIGLISQLLANIGISMPNLLGNSRYALMAVIGLSIWRGLGVNTLLFLAGLKSISREQLEAAEIDGANPLHSIIYIILPNMMHVIYFVVITTIIGCFQIFTIIHVLTQGGPNNATNMLVYRIWQEGFRFFNFGYANTISTFMFIMLLTPSILMVRVLTRQED